MTAQGIAYVELYTTQQGATVEYLVDSFGFTETARVERSGKRIVLVQQGGARLLVSTGPATVQFLDMHGDGVADIAFACDDVAATREAAVAAGARVLDDAPGTVVSGFGDVRHTLVPERSDRRSWPLSGLAWETASAGRVIGLDHVAVCLEAGRLAEGAQFYADGFGLEYYSSEYIEVGNQAMDSTVLRSPSNGVCFTMLEPDATKAPGQIDAFLERNAGPGVQHLAFIVEDIVSAVTEYSAAGVEFLTTPGAYYDRLRERFGGLEEEIDDLRRVNVLADRDEWGYLLQLFTRSPHQRNTLFYELIQRRGARGFGSANIRALYEAVERDQSVEGVDR